MVLRVLHCPRLCPPPRLPLCHPLCLWLCFPLWFPPCLRLRLPLCFPLCVSFSLYAESRNVAQTWTLLASCLKLNLESLLLLGRKTGWIVFTCLRHKHWNRALTFVQHPVLQTDTARYSNLICDGDVFVHHLICSCSYRLADLNKHGWIRADKPLPAETCLFEKYHVHTCELLATLTEDYAWPKR